MTSCIPFEDLLPGHVIRVTDDTPRLVWAVDLVMAITGYDRNVANEAMRNLVERGLFCKGNIFTKKQPGKGNYKTRLVTFPDAIELIMVLPGDKACAIRAKCAEIITRYLAGDTSLVQEMQANNQSDQPVNELARDSLGLGKRKIEGNTNDILEAAKLFFKAAHSTKLSAAERELVKATMLPIMTQGQSMSAQCQAPVLVDPDQRAVVSYLRHLLAQQELPSRLQSSVMYQQCKDQAAKDGYECMLSNIAFSKQLRAILGVSAAIHTNVGNVYKLDRDDLERSLSQLAII